MISIRFPDFHDSTTDIELVIVDLDNRLGP
jgi:hypothetical protein